MALPFTLPCPLWLDLEARLHCNDWGMQVAVLPQTFKDLAGHVQSASPTLRLMFVVAASQEPMAWQGGLLLTTEANMQLRSFAAQSSDSKLQAAPFCAGQMYIPSSTACPSTAVERAGRFGKQIMWGGARGHGMKQLHSVRDAMAWLWIQMSAMGGRLAAGPWQPQSPCGNFESVLSHSVHGPVLWCHGKEKEP